MQTEERHTGEGGRQEIADRREADRKWRQTEKRADKRGRQTEDRIEADETQPDRR